MKGISGFVIGTALSLGVSQSLMGVEPLTWDACVRLASQGSPDLRSARETLRSSEYQARGAWSGFLPQVSATAGYSYGNSAGSGGGDGLGGESANSTYSVSLLASENLFSGLQDRAKVDQAGANRSVVQANVDTTKAKVSFDLKSAFTGLLYAQGYLKLSQDIIRRRENNLRMVELRFENGRENKGSLLLSKAYLNQAKFENLQARNSIQVPQQQLAKVLGRDAREVGLIRGVVPTKDPDPQTDIQQVSLETPDHRQAIAQESAAEAGFKLARASLFPSLNVTGTVGEHGSQWFPDRDRWSLGLNLSVPLFSGGKDYYATRSAAAAFAAASFSRDSVDRQLLVKLQQAFATYVESVEKLKVDKSFLDAAAVREEISRNKYNNGLISFEDWDLIENDLIARQKSVLQSERDRIVSEAAWEQAQGKGVIP